MKNVFSHSVITENINLNRFFCCRFSLTQSLFRTYADEFRSKVACENEVIQLVCNPFSRIAIYSASYGRTSYESIQCTQPQGVKEESEYLHAKPFHTSLTFLLKDCIYSKKGHKNGQKYPQNKASIYSYGVERKEKLRNHNAETMAKAVLLRRNQPKRKEKQNSCGEAKQ